MEQTLDVVDVVMGQQHGGGWRTVIQLGQVAAAGVEQEGAGAATDFRAAGLAARILQGAGTLAGRAVAAEAGHLAGIAGAEQA